VRLSLFYEHGLPRPWDERAERDLFHQTLEQIELADRLGFHTAWVVEHHFLEEYAHCSAPEVFLGAASQRTQRIRLGHGIVQMPPLVNHPARVAERIAMLDLLSDGRVEFGTGEASSEAELGGFVVDPGKKRAMWEEALSIAVRCMADTPFTGINGQFVTMPPRNVVPKPLQKPHPPLWVACSRRATIHLAAEKGLGALTFAWVDPEESVNWIKDYYETLATSCVPIGRAVNANVACVTMLMCARTEDDAVARAIEGGNFFGYGSAHYYAFGKHRPGQTNLWDEFVAMQDEAGYSTRAAAAVGERLEAKVDDAGTTGLRGSVGTPAQIREYVRRYEDAGADELVFLVQGGRHRHEDIMASLELFGTEVLPEFAERDAAAAEKKAAWLEPIVDAAMARRVDETPALDPGYEFGAIPKSWEDERPHGDMLEFFDEVARRAAR